jgi:hypothetical protein
MNTNECIQSKKACHEAVFSRNRNRKGDGAVMPNEFSRSLLRRRNSVSKRNKRERDNKREKEGAMNTIECIQSKQACYEAVIQSEAKPQKKGSSDAECIQSEPPPKTSLSQ